LLCRAVFPYGSIEHDRAHVALGCAPHCRTMRYTPTGLFCPNRPRPNRCFISRKKASTFQGRRPQGTRACGFIGSVLTTKRLSTLPSGWRRSSPAAQTAKGIPLRNPAGKGGIGQHQSDDWRRARRELAQEGEARALPGLLLRQGISRVAATFNTGLLPRQRKTEKTSPFPTRGQSQRAVDREQNHPVQPADAVEGLDPVSEPGKTPRLRQAGEVRDQREPGPSGSGKPGQGL